MILKKILVAATAAVLLCLVLATNNCIMETRVVEVVLTDDLCATFIENHDSENFTNPELVNLGTELDSILTENGYTRENIKSAHIVSAKYKVLDFSHTHDWVISGAVTVQRQDITSATENLILYSSQSVKEALGVEHYADLDSIGVAVLNEAVVDFLDGGNPVILLMVVNGNVEPDPSPADPIVFTWQACVVMQLVIEIELDIVEPV